MITITLEDQGFKRVDGRWQYPKVTPTPLARFFAEVPGATLDQQGIVKFSQGVAESYPRKATEDGYHGFEVLFKGNRDPEKDKMRELRYEIARPLPSTLEIIQVKIPKNFEHRTFDAIMLDAPVGSLDWKEGQTVVSLDGDREVDRATLRKVDKGRNDSSKVGVWVEGAQHVYHVAFKVGYVLKNLETGESAKILRRGFEASNNKFSAQWVGRYSNGGMIVEYAKDKQDPFSYIKAQITTTETYRNNGSETNQLPGKLSKPAWIAEDEKGKWVNFAIQRIRSTDKDSKDGGWRIWKSVDDLNYERLEPFFESMGHHVFTTANDNKFDAGYLFGWINSGFDTDTYFYLRDYQLWADLPEFIRNHHA